MTEIFYKNNTGELHKVLLHNISGKEFIKKQNHTCFNILCGIEDGVIIYASPEFKIIEENISMILIDLISEPN
jgi:hypothetical protein